MNGGDIEEGAYRSIGRLYGCAADDDFILEKGPLSLVYQRHRRLSASQSRRETRLVEGGGRRRKDEPSFMSALQMLTSRWTVVERLLWKGEHEDPGMTQLTRGI
jgi:hypothetical protein